jgi:hypothetical protein
VNLRREVGAAEAAEREQERQEKLPRLVDEDALDRELVEKCWQRIQGAIKDEDGALDDFDVRRRCRQRIARWQELGGSGDVTRFTLA